MPAADTVSIPPHERRDRNAEHRDGPRRLHAVGAARRLPRRNPGAHRGAQPRRRHRFGVRRAGHLRALPSLAQHRRVREARHRIPRIPPRQCDRRGEEVRPDQGSGGRTAPELPGVAARRRRHRRAGRQPDPPPDGAQGGGRDPRPRDRSGGEALLRRARPPQHGRSGLRPHPVAGHAEARMGARRHRRRPELPPAPVRRPAGRRDVRRRLEGHRRGAWGPRADRGVARVQGTGVRARDRRRHHHHRGASLQPRDRGGRRQQRHDESPDPVRRGSDEPHLLPSAERRPGPRAHRRGAGRDPRARRRRGRRGGGRPRGHRRGDAGRQPDHAPPRARHRPDPARDGAVPAGGRSRRDRAGARPRDGPQPRRLRVLPSLHRGARGRGHRRGHPLPGPAPRRRDDPGDRRRHQRRDRARLREPASSPPRAPPGRRSRAHRSRTGSVRRRARSSACGSTPTP